MFGYIKIFKDELKFKDFDAYKAVYCSLCRTLGKDYGLVARMTLNYDFTFLALLKLSLQQEEPCFEKCSCSFNPLHKCKKCTSGDSALHFSAAAAMLMIHYKLLDDVDDEKSIKRFLSNTALKAVNRSYKKASASYPQLDSIMKEMHLSQSKAEKENLPADAYAHATADALGKIFSLGETGEKNQILYRMGYCLGRYVYFIDALDDYDKDVKSGSFNVFKACNNISCAQKIINQSAAQALAAFYLLENGRYSDIIENILDYGLKNTIMTITDKYKEKR